MPMEITARLGSARPMLETLMARNDARCRWPSQTPSGIAMAIATASEANEMLQVGQGLAPTSGSGCWPKNVNESMSVCMLQVLLRRAHGVSSRCDHDQQYVGRRAPGAMASAPAAMNSVLKPVWIASKIGSPRPPAPM